MILLRSNRHHLPKLLASSLGRRYVHQQQQQQQHQTPENETPRDSGLSSVRTSSIPAEDTYDIVINGGGIVGFSFLAAIKSLPMLSTKRVLLIEQQKEPKFKPETAEELGDGRQFSNRVSAITCASAKLFEDMGIWSQLEPLSKRIDGMHIWSDHYQNALHFADQSDGATCYIVENSRMIRSLVERVRQDTSDCQKVAYGRTVEDVDQVKVDDPNSLCDESTSVLVKLSANEAASSKILQTKLLIGCDGFKSLVRSRSTLPYYAFELQQMGIVGTVQLESPIAENTVAFQRFVSDQLVIGLLPLSRSHASFVLSVQAKHLKSWMDLSDEDFVQRLNSEITRETRSNPLDRIASQISQSFTGFLVPKQSPFQSRIPPIVTDVVSGSRAPFPLGFGTTVPKLVGNIKTSNYLVRHLQQSRDFANTAIIGDAAHRVHPLAGQGLNLGLGDVAELAHQLEASLARGGDLFGSTVDAHEALTGALHSFERARVAKLVPMLGAIHTMQTVMSWTPSAFLSIANSLPWLKSQVVAFANSR